MADLSAARNDVESSKMNGRNARALSTKRE
jgi:hypothetical protein